MLTLFYTDLRNTTGFKFLVKSILKWFLWYHCYALSSQCYNHIKRSANSILAMNEFTECKSYVYKGNFYERLYVRWSKSIRYILFRVGKFRYLAEGILQRGPWTSWLTSFSPDRLGSGSESLVEHVAVMVVVSLRWLCDCCVWHKYNRYVCYYFYSLVSLLSPTTISNKSKLFCDVIEFRLVNVQNTGHISSAFID